MLTTSVFEIFIKNNNFSQDWIIKKIYGILLNFSTYFAKIVNE